MLLVEMPKSSSGEKLDRQLWFSEDIGKALDERAENPGIPISRQIESALRFYLQMPHDPAHRLYVTNKEVIKGTTVSQTLWNTVKARKKQTDLDYGEQAMIAVALYLQRPEMQPQSENKADTSDFELTPTPEKPRRPKPVHDNTVPVDREVYREVVREELAKAGIPTWGVIPAILQKTVRLPLTKIVTCGSDGDIDFIVVPCEDGTMVELKGELADKTTDHSFMVKANGWSMSADNLPQDIKPGDLLLMTPLDEFKMSVQMGDVVLAQVTYKDGRVIETLKTYNKNKNLTANNPAFKHIEFGKDVEQAIVVAVCRGIKERVFR